MKPPTSPYGCGQDECEACYGDREWRLRNAIDGNVVEHMTDDELHEALETADAEAHGAPWDLSRQWVAAIEAEIEARS